MGKLLDEPEIGRLALPTEPVLSCDHCNWTDEKPPKLHAHGCPNFQFACKTCDDTGLAKCDDKDCTNDGFFHVHALQQCTRPCRCVLVATSTSKSDFEACPTCKDLFCDGTCKSRRLAARLARAEVRRRLPSDVKTGSRARRPSGSGGVDYDLLQASEDLHPDGCTCSAGYGTCRSCDRLR